MYTSYIIWEVINYSTIGNLSINMYVDRWDNYYETFFGSVVMMQSTNFIRIFLLHAP